MELTKQMKMKRDVGPIRAQSGCTSRQRQRLWNWGKQNLARHWRNLQKRGRGGRLSHSMVIWEILPRLTHDPCRITYLKTGDDVDLLKIPNLMAWWMSCRSFILGFSEVSKVGGTGIPPDWSKKCCRINRRQVFKSRSRYIAPTNAVTQSENKHNGYAD